MSTPSSAPPLTLSITPSPMFSLVLSPPAELTSKVQDSEPRKVEFDLLPSWMKEGTGGVKVTLLPKIPDNKSNIDDVLLVAFKRGEYDRMVKHIATYHRTMKKQRTGDGSKNPKPHLPDIITDRIIREIPVKNLAKLGELLQLTATT